MKKIISAAMFLTLLAGVAGAKDSFARWTDKTSRAPQQDGTTIMTIVLSGKGLPTIQSVVRVRESDQEKVGASEISIDGEKLTVSYDADNKPSAVSGSKGSLTLKGIQEDVAKITGTINGKTVSVDMFLMYGTATSDEGNTTLGERFVLTGDKSEANVMALAYVLAGAL